MPKTKLFQFPETNSVYVLSTNERQTQCLSIINQLPSHQLSIMMESQLCFQVGIKVPLNSARSHSEIWQQTTAGGFHKPSEKKQAFIPS